MIAELGHFSLILAFMVAIYQTTVPMVGAAKGWHGWMDSARPAALAQLILMLISFGALTIAFVTSDFSVLLVYENSHTAKPLLYKISGVWGNHEGSMLLWVTILALFGAAAALFGGNLPPSLRARVLGVQAAIGAAFYAFIIFTSNPFWRLGNPPFNGQDLNPLLQDPGLAFHPPQWNHAGTCQPCGLGTLAMNTLSNGLPLRTSAWTVRPGDSGAIFGHGP